MKISGFEKALFDYFVKLGFYSKNKSFYKSINSITLKFFVQRSAYSDVCYINFWIIIDGLHSNENLFKLKIGDIIGRVIYVIGNEEKRSFFSILEPTKIKVELKLKEPIKNKKETN